MELCTFCFTKEIATLLTLSSLQFAVAVGRNDTVKTPGTAIRTLRRPSGADAYDPAHETPSIRVSPKDAYPCEAHYNGKLPMDSVPMTANSSPALTALQQKSLSLNLIRCRRRVQARRSTSPLVPRQREYIRAYRRLARGWLPALFECYNQGMSDKSAAELITVTAQYDGKLS
jgi:hypothetical protein